MSVKDSILIGTIDQSTTATKFVVFNSEGNEIDKEIIPHDQITLHPGWLQHDGLEILKNTYQAIQTTIGRLTSNGYSVAQIKTIGITNQRETIIAWNKRTGQPYYNAIVWSDTRTRDICNKYIEKYEGNSNVFSKITGLPITTYFSAFKIRWLLENVPQIAQELKENVIFGTMDSWIIWNLTNKLHLTDVTNASRTFLLNITTLQYDQHILEEFQIPITSLPKVLPSSHLYGYIDQGPLKGIPIHSCLGDQQASSLGHGLFNVGGSKNTYGTGCFFLVNIGTQPVFKEGGLLTTVLFQLGADQPAYYALEGSIEAGGSSINWARDHLGLFSDFKELKSLVESVEDNGGLCFVPAFSGLFSPYWKEDAAGCILGLTLFSRKEHILRALLEGIAFRTKDMLQVYFQVIDEVENCTGNKIQSLKVDGGLTNSDFLMKFQANVLQKKVLLTQVQESTCLGTAFSAGLACGIFKNAQEVESKIKGEREVNYNEQQQQEFINQYAVWQKAIQKSFGWKTNKNEQPK